jgi:hypothetical protein
VRLQRGAACVRAAGSNGASPAAAAAAKSDYRSKPASDVNVLVVGPTGYIGKCVAVGACLCVLV